ncbi:Oidioi.mRNA.OKI2018_I69.XSR.g16540.t2.cds [Oikopleura dioica]|uniref:Oidioi.mRNA.OKI2018_I69.XSR.g16540.t2.cds n=1 Tax=Oikopleura dioica TaxID=34765 RepID=A0ABN7SKF3_OIKDI|nr:Oidioi.mRNA.OKI2018_I69.XSR.g16540.t2.cds [Oikopleura dioica]
MAKSNDHLSQVFTDFYQAQISKEVSAKDSTITVYDLQLNHAKAVTNAAYRVLVEQGSRAAKTYLAHLEYVLGGMCQMEMKFRMKFDNERGCDYFKHWLAPEPAERKNAKADSAREQLLEAIELVLLKHEKKAKELEEANLENQRLERSITSMQRQLEDFKDKLILDRERKKPNGVSSRVSDKWSQENSDSPVPEKLFSEKSSSRNRRSLQNEERPKPGRRGEKDQEHTITPRGDGNSRRQPQRDGETRRDRRSRGERGKINGKKEDVEWEENVEDFHDKVKNLSIKDTDEREVQIERRDRRSQGDSRKRRSRPLESASPDRVVEEGDKASNSTWFPGDKRARWERPCFENYEVVVLGDSQLKEFGKSKINLDGYNITSFSGCDILELIYILRTGALKDQFTNENPFAKRSNRERFDNGIKKNMMPLSNFCPCCESNCMKKFTGRLIIGIGLNNALKVSEAGFEKQDVRKLLQCLNRDIKYCMPKLKSLHFVQPIKVPRWAFEGEEGQISLDVYRELLEVLKDYPCSPAAPLLTERDFDDDATHLAPRASERYWKAHFNAIESS